MSANYGGTEMQAALEHVLRTRKTDIPSAIIVLTDGEVSILRTFAISHVDKSPT